MAVIFELLREREPPLKLVALEDIGPKQAEWVARWLAEGSGYPVHALTTSWLITAKPFMGATTTVTKVRRKRNGT